VWLAAGVVYPAEGPTTKSLGREVTEPFGPITGWSLVRATPKAGAAGAAKPKGGKPGAAAAAADHGAAWAVHVTTSAGVYIVDKPAGSYKKLWSELAEQCTLTSEVMGAVVPALGGNVDVTLDEVVARLARSGAAKGYGSAREALLLNGAFVLQQIEADDCRRRGVPLPKVAAAAAAAAAAGGKDKGKGPAVAPAAADKGKGAASLVMSGAFVQQLQSELSKGPLLVGQLMQEGGALKIASDGPQQQQQEQGEADAATRADEDMARRLQAKLDAEAAGGGSK
jgi:DNA (cytosine-5)-methyltransferase 1